jgi:nucleotide-binding universal stress UspA family protein
MDYKTVMVGLALDRPNDACLKVAGDLAERFGARVIGAAATDLRPPMYFAEGDFAQKLLDEEAAAIVKRLSELEVEFRASVEKRAISVEWRSARALPVPHMLQQSKAADIIVVGARPKLWDTSAAADPSDLVMQAGRPLIVVPPMCNGSICGAFWSPGRTCGKSPCQYSMRCRSWRRQRKSRLSKFERSGHRAAAASDVADVAAWLRGHGIAAHTVVSESTAGIVDQLEKTAANVG